MNGRLDRHRARFVPVELERRQEVHVFDRLDMPAGKQAQGSFGKRLDAHDTGQHRRAVNLVIVQERLNRRVQRGLDREATVEPTLAILPIIGPCDS